MSNHLPPTLPAAPAAPLSTYVIAEAGVNHNGDLEMALQLVDAAAKAGADAVKFQTFRSADLVARHAPKAEYQMQTTDNNESQFEMIRRLELSPSAHDTLHRHCAARGIEFLSTPFDTESLHMLVERFGMRTIKVSSGDLNNAPFLLDIARSSQRVILSTGMATLADIEAALGVLAYGWLADSASASPSRSAFEAAFALTESQQSLRERVVVLHCTTEYPAPCNEVNLRAMATMAAAFPVSVGYSDHTQGIHIPLAAVAMGATLIEKHFTLDRELPGPDHKASLLPSELAAMVHGIREVEQALGDGVKRPTTSEWKNRAVARKSLVAARDISVGEPLALACKRPGDGRSPFDFWQLQQQLALRAYAADEAIDS
jgi:N-acetylneuraminate synthase